MSWAMSEQELPNYQGPRDHGVDLADATGRREEANPTRSGRKALEPSVRSYSFWMLRVVGSVSTYIVVF